MTAAEMYERVRAACCEFHGFRSDEELDLHARHIVLTILRFRGAV